MSNIKKMMEILLKAECDSLIIKPDEHLVVKKGVNKSTPFKKVFTSDDVELISREYKDIFKRQEMVSYNGINFLIKESNEGFELINLGQSAVEKDGFSATDGETQIINRGVEKDDEKALTISIDELLLLMKKRGASDLHVSTGCSPFLRVDGDIEVVENHPEMLQDCLMNELNRIMPEINKNEFEISNDTDFAYELKGVGRFRTNIFKDINGVGAVFRMIPSEILTVDQLNIPEAFVKLCDVPKGLILVTGPTGSGKSTTLAALIDHINKTGKKHIITIEDPIEFVYKNSKSLINQREISTHTRSFKSALRAALREDPDIILVGEMRDLETISIAIEMAVTGHLVFGTLHTSTAIATIDRIIDQFPSDQQSQIRAMLTDTLTGVCSQTLLKKKGGGRVGAFEILLGTIGVRNLIREGKNFQIGTMMQTGKGIGMQVLNSALLDLVKQEIIEPEEALLKAIDKENLKSQLRVHGLLEEVSDNEIDSINKNIA